MYGGVVVTLMSTLPQEVIDSIIDHLYDDIQSCKACLQAHRCMKDAAYTQIFRTVPIVQPANTFDNSGTYIVRRFRRFYDLLKTSPHIALYVRKLILWEEATQLQRRQYRRGWMHTEQDLARLLAALPKLQALHLDGHNDYLSWQDMTDAVKQGITTVLLLPSLRSVVVQRFNDFPITTVLSSPSLTYLGVLHCDGVFLDRDPTTTPVEELLLHDISMTLLRWLSSPIASGCLSSLTSLTLWPSKEQNISFPRHLHRVSDDILSAAPNLVNLVFAPIAYQARYNPCNESIIHLTNNRKLETFELCMDIKFVGNTRSDFVAWAAMTINTIPDEAPLSSIVLRGDAAKRIEPGAVICCGWDQFDDAAIRATSKVVVSLEGLAAFAKEEVASSLQMPRLRERGILEIRMV